MALPSRLRVAAILWAIFAFLAWNVVFDHQVIEAGREYLRAATRAADQSSPPLLIAPWMQPAVSRAFWTATSVACVIAVVGVVGLFVGSRAKNPNS